MGITTFHSYYYLSTYNTLSHKFSNGGPLFGDPLVRRVGLERSFHYETNIKTFDRSRD